ncbi:zinc ABC transporter substrate-binding protein AztC [Rhodococcus triatomae]
MRIRLGGVLSALAVVAGALTGCAITDDRSSIVVTTNILGDVVQEIVGDQAQVTVLMKPNSDPHSFGVSAQEANSLQTADLVVFNGLGLEEGVLHHVDAAETEGIPVVEVGAAVDPLAYGDGDTTGQDDPHFWTDPTRVALAVDLLAAEVIEHVPGVDETVVRDRAAAYRTQLEDLDRHITALFAGIPPEQRKLITNHHVFAYLAERYDFTIVGAVVPSGTTLASPSASDLASLVGAIEANGVRTIFADSSQPDRLARVIADTTGTEVDIRSLYTESLGEPGSAADSYLKMMRYNATQIGDGLA